MSLVVNPYAYFTDTNGDALNGYLYIGEVGKNAENYPIAIYYDALLTTPAPNPLTVSAGYIYNGGTIAQIYAAVDYSLIAKTTGGSLVYSSLNESGMTNGAIGTIDEMKEFVAPYNNYALNVLGYSEAGDGGGGLFYYDANSTEADNGGTIIEPTSGSGRWIRQYSGTVNVKWFGAKGDWNETNNTIITDDTSSIQNTINYCNTTKESVYIDPNCTGYTISSPLILYSGSIITGTGIIKNTVSTIAIYAYSKTNITIRDLTVIGSRVSNGSGIDGDKGIYFNLCSNILVENVTTKNTFAWGVIANICNNVTFKNLDCSDTQAQSCIALTNGTYDASVSFCTVYNTGLYGLEIEGLQAGGSNTKNITVIGLNATDCYTGISIVRADNISISECNVYDNNTYNIFAEEVSQLNVIRNTIYGSKNPIFLRDCVTGKLRDNNIGLNSLTAVSLGLLYYYIETASLIPTTDFTISGNTFNCYGVNTKVLYISNSTLVRVSFIDNTLVDVGANLMTLKTIGLVDGNKILTNYSSTPSAIVITPQNNIKTRVTKLEGSNVLATANLIFDTAVILLSISVKYSYTTAVSTDWRIYMGPSAGAGIFIGTSGTPNTLLVTNQSIPYLVSANTNFPISIKRSDDVYKANYIEVKCSYLELCNN